MEFEVFIGGCVFILVVTLLGLVAICRMSLTEWVPEAMEQEEEEDEKE